VDFEETREEYHEKYGGALKVNADRVVNENNEEWSSSLSPLRLKKGEGRLPPRAERVGVPGYWEGGETRRGKSPLAVRQDGYAVDEEKRRLMLKDFGLEVEFAGAEVGRQRG